MPQAAETEDIVGCVLSIVTLEPSSTVVSATPAFPAESEYATEKVIPPSPSASDTDTTQVQTLPPVFVTVTELSMVAPSPSVMVHVGVWIVSEPVIVSVTVSPLLALPAPLVAIPTVPRVG